VALDLMFGAAMYRRATGHGGLTAADADAIVAAAMRGLAGRLLNHTMSTYPEIETAFDEIVDRFGGKPRCEGSDRCTRPARWRVNLHGCEQAIMCAQHKSAWLRKMKGNVGILRCARCGTEFDSVDDAVTVVGI
jgi:hypothetical protein